MFLSNNVLISGTSLMLVLTHGMQENELTWPVILIKW